LLLHNNLISFNSKILIYNSNNNSNSSYNNNKLISINKQILINSISQVQLIPLFHSTMDMKLMIKIQEMPKLTKKL